MFSLEVNLVVGWNYGMESDLSLPVVVVGVRVKDETGALRS